MRSRNCPLLMIGLLALGFLVVNHATPWGPTEAQAQADPGDPIIQIVSPAGEPRYTRPGNPIDPAITVDVAVEFPIVETTCVGANTPVDTSTLEVYLWRVIDGVMQEEWPVDTSSGWTWTGTAPDRVEGQVTIGGVGSGQNRSRYGLYVCIENAAARKCQLGGMVRVEYPVSEFTAAYYSVTKGTSFSQGGAGCTLIPSAAFSLLNQQMAAEEFQTITPNGAGIVGGTNNTVSFINIPLIGAAGPIDMTASLNEPANDLDLAEVAVSGIDLSGIGFPGTNCVISGKADGNLLGEVSPGQDLDGSIRVYDIELALGGGTGTCDLVAAPTCELNLKFDGNK
jgi:hypothetical protein